MPFSLFAAVLFASAALALALPPEQLRVLFLGGGTTSHDPAAMRAVLQPVFEKSGMQITYRTDEAALHADTLARFDALFVYNAKKGSKTDGTPDLTPSQEDALYAWVEAGHPVIAAHSATSSYLENPRWAELLGAAYTQHGANFESITITRADHPALQGVSPPTAWDEGREHRLLRQDLVVLATLNDGQNPWIWVRPQGRGWVYYTSSGHDTRTWSDTAYQNQLVQALRWGVSASKPTTRIAVPFFASSAAPTLSPFSAAFSRSAWPRIAATRVLINGRKSVPAGAHSRALPASPHLQAKARPR